MTATVENGQYILARAGGIFDIFLFCSVCEYVGCVVCCGMVLCVWERDIKNTSMLTMGKEKKKGIKQSEK